jgi:PAS domain S-box-containing protein
MALAWLLFQPCGVTSGSEPQQKLLILYTYRMGGFGPVEIERALESTFYNKQLTNRLDLYTEYIDSIRFPEEEYQLALRKFFRRKYARQKLDLIIPISGPAIRMAQALRDELFPGVPIVFCLGFRETLQHMKQATQITGVTVRLDPKGTLDLALKAQPDTREVIVIGGRSNDDLYCESVARQELREFENRVTISYLTRRPLEEVLQQVANLPRQTIILFLSLFEDGAGKKFLPRDALIRIAKAAKAPVYGLVDFGPGSGIVGGSLLNVGIAAREAAELALRVLDGKRPEEIPIIESHATLPMVDWHQLRRWGIEEARLPSGTIVRDREPSFWALYRWRIIAIVSLCLVQAALIVGLLINRARRGAAERGLRRRLRFETLLSELSAEFMTLPASEARSGIEKWTNRLSESLGLDEAVFTEIPKPNTDDPDRSNEAVARARADLADGDLEPYLDQLRRGETVSLSDMPEVRSEQKERSEGARVKSLLAIPISSNGSTYVARFSTTKVARGWPDELVSRLRVVGEIFTGTLERRMAAETLRESEERYRALVTGMAHVVWRTNALGEVLFASSAWQGLTGQSYQEMRGFGWLNTVHPEDRGRTQQAWNQAVKTKRPYQDEFRVQTVGGKRRSTTFGEFKCSIRIYRNETDLRVY